VAACCLTPSATRAVQRQGQPITEKRKTQKNVSKTAMCEFRLGLGARLAQAHETRPGMNKAQGNPTNFLVLVLRIGRQDVQADFRIKCT